MLFSTTTFIIIFLPIVIAIYYGLLRKTNTLKNVFLFLVSILFYAWGEPYFVLIMLLSIIANWFFGGLVDKYRENKIKVKIVIVLMFIFNLSILGVFKYLNFIISNTNAFFHTNFVVPNIVLPIGISFFTFQAISYVLDIYKKDAEAQKNPLNMGLYIAFFPQLIAGPIVRYKTIAEQIEQRKETFEKFSQGVQRFIKGLAKKVLLSNSLAIVADYTFGMIPSELSVLLAWLGIISYTLQIYFDFSGYSDMAIGLAKMFGFELEENFNFPYISKTITEFWRRWHISLGTWFRDYVYIPLGGSRVGKKRLILNLFIVWSLTGLWHGANWTFIAWGIFYFVLLTIEKLTKIDKKQTKNKLLIICQHIYTVFFVMIGWVLFRSDNLGYAIQYIKSLFGFMGNAFINSEAILYLKEYGIYMLLGILFSIPLGKVLPKYRDNKGFKIIYGVATILIFYVCLSYIIKGTYNPFIYFNF